MRRLFVLFFICVLPFRSWAGDLMTVQMATAPMAGHAMDTMPADCPMHGHSQAVANDDGAAADQDSMEGCNSCDLCLPLAETTATQMDAVAFASHVLRAACGPVFLSCAPAPSFKPPIS